MKKYIVIGGLVTSKSDGDEHYIHYISPEMLCRLYKVNPNECYLFRNSHDPLIDTLPKLPLLTPRYHGDYNLSPQPQGEKVK